MRTKRDAIINQMQTERCTICEYCGAKKEGLSFCIGASNKAEWTMIYGTGKMTCPACYDKAQAEATALIDAHVKAHSSQVA